ncbi:hypothetical protein, partial [Rhodococcus sp. O3]|uniref:hypothetical protein n=1 Tax=Rhodococcus sp. O3 TaxID=3404919 RepID=UPI003B67AF13
MTEHNSSDKNNNDRCDALRFDAVVGPESTRLMIGGGVMKSTSSITDHPIREILRPGSAGH